ncbi:hypothetical protein AcV5_008355 [Taiwanofungus camphoratus]|nr:hypothetical protein AcV5_008355 [Antrodia cinnamomea]KAI0955778.1 hypothetical protein AcV7_006353 [Antrodia cinnamomea]
MTTNKPRNSVLYLFDPLKSPVTPRRDSSPDSGSDKENDAPPGEFTVFFNRIYPSKNHAVLKTPEGRLIDFSDTTMDDAWATDEAIEIEPNEDMNHPEGSPCVSQGRSETRLQTPSMSRIPLADIDLEKTPRSHPIRIPPRLRQDIEKLPDDSIPASHVTAAPSSSPLAEVINAINLSAMTISAAEPSTPTTLCGSSKRVQENEEAADTSLSPEFPQIRVCSPPPSDSSAVTIALQPSPPTNRLTAGSAPTLRPPSATQISVDDPRRTSVDLHTSFSLHMQSAEMSFDLLNDKIPFLGSAQDSFWAGIDDADFDMEAEEKNMETIVKEYASPEAVQLDIHRDTFDDVDSWEVADSPSLTQVNPPEMMDPAQEFDSDARLLTLRSTVSSELPQEAGSGQAITKDAEPVVAGVYVQPVSPDHNEDNTESTETVSTKSLQSELPTTSMLPAQVGSSTPVRPLVVSVVPALRIIKKTLKVHGRLGSTTNIGSAASSSSSTSSSSRKECSGTDASSIRTSSTQNQKNGQRATVTTTIEATEVSTQEAAISSPIDVPVSARAPRTVIRGVQRPPIPLGTTGGAVILPSASAPVLQRGFRQMRTRLANGTAPDTGPRRIAVAEVQRPNLQQCQAQMQTQTHTQKQTQRARVDTANQFHKVVPPAGSVGASIARAGMIRAPSAGVPNGSSSTGPRPPSRAGVGSSGASALPRPTSRLPAPGMSASNVGRSAGLRGKDAKASVSGGKSMMTGGRVGGGSLRRGF